MRNDNRKSLSPYRELFDHGTWGGAWGGDYLLEAQKVEGYFQFWRKTHIFKATGGAHGGAQKWRGEWVGKFSHTWWGDGGGASDTYETICSEKNEIFEFRNLIEI